jgi:hypothetical protein
MGQDFAVFQALCEPVAAAAQMLDPDGGIDEHAR